MIKKDTLQLLRQKEFELNTLLKITQAINENFSREQLYGIFQNLLTRQLNVGHMALFCDDNGWRCVQKYGVRGKGIIIDLERDLFPISKVSEIKPTGSGWTQSFNYIVPVFHKKKPLAYLLLGEIKADKEEVLNDYIPFIQTLTNIIIVAIEAKKLYKETIRQEGIKKELELASKMQAMLFPEPESLPNNERVEMAASYMPHHQVGGDYYDYVKLNDHEMLFCMADVSGKGITAALLMSNFQANLRALCKYNHSLKEIVSALNRKVMETSKGEMFITLFLATYNMNDRSLCYINAGHPPPIVLPGEKKQLSSNGKEEVIELKTGSTGLGMLSEIPKINEGILNLSSESILVCYTDGVVELENSDQQPYGVERLVKLIIGNRKLPMDGLNKCIDRELKRHKGRQPFLDDIALLSCRFY